MIATPSATDTGEHDGDDDDDSSEATIHNASDTPALPDSSNGCPTIDSPDCMLRRLMKPFDLPNRTAEVQLTLTALPNTRPVAKWINDREPDMSNKDDYNAFQRMMEDSDVDEDATNPSASDEVSSETTSSFLHTAQSANPLSDPLDFPPPNATRMDHRRHRAIRRLAVRRGVQALARRMPPRPHHSRTSGDPQQAAEHLLEQSTGATARRGRYLACGGLYAESGPAAFAAGRTWIGGWRGWRRR